LVNEILGTTCNYPPDEILQPVMAKPNYELIILWILNNNKKCTWSDLKEKVKRATLSIYLKKLISSEYIIKSDFNQYKISTKGQERFYELSQIKKGGRRLSHPPKIILEKRNYDHWILWMVYNNNYCVWSDFLDEPLSINQSSLSKNLNRLLEKEFVRKEDKEYRITRQGKSEYAKMLEYYDLDRQSILEEESKRIADLTQKTLNFYEKFEISEREIQFRFLNCVLRLDYERLQTVLKNEEDFHKILLFLALNHPSEYPNHISSEEFSEKYHIKKTTLDYYVDEIVENQIYPIRFFRLEISPDTYYYFQSNEKMETMLRVITKEHITKFTYLNKLFENSSDLILPLDMNSTVNAILEEACNYIFNKELKNSLRTFLPGYVRYLAYKIEKKRKLVGIADKLEGIIWQNIPNMFQNTDEVEYQYAEKLEEANKAIEKNPETLELYYSKLRILLYFDQFDEVITLLDEMISKFPEEESDLLIKKAYIFKEKRNLEAGLTIIEELIQKYPEENKLLLHKAYWLQYLERGEEALDQIRGLIEKEPENGLFLDTYGEMLMNFEDYEAAATQFQKAIEMSKDKWYFYQSYIKLGICNKELENYDAALDNLKKGLEFTEKASIESDKKQEWLSIANLFILEIEQMDEDF
jgi:Mn-dependent DtxR family transcriptional regulator